MMTIRRSSRIAKLFLTTATTATKTTTTTATSSKQPMTTRTKPIMFRLSACSKNKQHTNQKQNRMGYSSLLLLQLLVQCLLLLTTISPVSSSSSSSSSSSYSLFRKRFHYNMNKNKNQNDIFTTIAFVPNLLSSSGTISQIRANIGQQKKQQTQSQINKYHQHDGQNQNQLQLQMLNGLEQQYTTTTLCLSGQSRRSTTMMTQSTVVVPLTLMLQTSVLRQRTSGRHTHSQSRCRSRHRHRTQLCMAFSSSNKKDATNNKSMSTPPLLNDWKVLTNGRVVGTVKNHPSIPDGDIITTSPISRPDQVGESKIVTTISGSRYKLGKANVQKITSSSNKSTSNGVVNNNNNKVTESYISIQELQKRSRVVFDLNRDVVGDDTRQYLLAGKPVKSTSGKSVIYKAYRADDDGLPQGDALTVKISSNWEAIEREADNYSKITKTGLIRGQFADLMDYLPSASIITKKFKNQSALVMERGVTDLKRYIAVNGKLTGIELREAAAAAAQCIQAVHASGLVWTDMKSENFVVTSLGKFKGIDLESAMPVNDNPVDYSPEGTPPEFARSFLAGDGPYFVLQYSYDIWSLGMLFYELATGKGYFDGKSPIQITKLLARTDKPIEIDTRAIADPTFRNLVAKCIQVDPKKRPNIIQVLLHPYFLSTGIGPLSFGK